MDSLRKDGGRLLYGASIGKANRALLMKRHPLAGHAFVKLELGNVIALDGHEPSGRRVIIGVKVIEPRWGLLFAGLWERANEVHAGSDGLVSRGRIRPCAWAAETMATARTRGRRMITHDSDN
jgi:hypothetical protein